MHEPQYFEIYVVVPFSHVLKRTYVRITINLFFFFFFNLPSFSTRFIHTCPRTKIFYMYNFDDGMNSP